MRTDLFSIAYCGPVSYYQHWNRSENPVLEVCENYLKQTWRNRCLIATANGPMALSIPIENIPGKKGIQDIRLSEHGNWRHMHWYSIESAYNSSPFFEFYEDDLKPHFKKDYRYLLDFNEGLHQTLCELLDIRQSYEKTEEYLRTEQLPADCMDWRNVISPKFTENPDEKNVFKVRPYYQVFDRKYGFQPNLSVLDLLFNMGPESILYL